MNVIARLEYELAYYDSAVHYTTRTPPFHKGYSMKRNANSLVQNLNSFRRVYFPRHWPSYEKIFLLTLSFTLFLSQSIYIYIYVVRERERERERGVQTDYRDNEKEGEESRLLCWKSSGEWALLLCPYIFLFFLFLQKSRVSSVFVYLLHLNGRTGF